MQYFMNLPRNKKEFALFMIIVSLISVNIIAPVITGFEMGFHWSTWTNTLHIMPFIWLCVVVFVLLTYKPAGWLTSRIVTDEDSFNAHILTNVICTVFMMSIFLTVFCAWIGQQQITVEPLQHFFDRWPRNFSIALGVELLVAQPIARRVMRLLHQMQEQIAE